ncbi:MAG: sulfotransferase [Sphingomonadaceae bacterium]|nr:sulfotransferase [Sphingomonadaceae bacterium]
MTASAHPDPATILNRCVQLAQRGKLAEARQQAAEALANRPADPLPFLAFCGMVCARMGDLDAAVDYLAQAHEKRPQDITIACNLIATLNEAGRQQAALDIASAELAAADQSLRVARYRAFLAQQLERFDEAIPAYEMIIARAPNDFECWNNLGNARSGAGDFAGAVEALQRAVALDPGAAPARLNLGAALLSDEREADAIAMFEGIAQDFPDDTQALNQLYFHYKQQGLQEEAMEVLQRAVSRDPDSADLQIKLGAEYSVLRDTKAAETAYRRALALDPLEIDGYLGLAIQFEHTNREDLFAPLIAEARGHGVDDASLAFIEALELRRQKRFEEALAKLDAIPDDIELVRTAHMRATLLDRLGQSDDAYAAFTHVNAMLAETPTEPLARASELRRKLSEEIALLEPSWLDSWQAAEISDPRPDPVFLVGFPRSGTTLLDTILMGHPDTVVMEEQPPLNHVEEQFGGIAALPCMDSATIMAARAAYFAEVDALQPVASGQLLVDKSPLFLYRLPLIRRLFPNARIILALRHPCDVVLSCLMSNFRLNPAMANFLRLEDAAEFYDLCFTHWQASRGLFPENIYALKYEELVEDVSEQVRPLLEWLGLEWHDNVLDHTSTARSRDLITTASYSQVVEPIYRRASGRWKRYHKHLEPALPRLAPWIASLGYDPVGDAG